MKFKENLKKYQNKITFKVKPRLIHYLEGLGEKGIINSEIFQEMSEQLKKSFNPKKEVLSSEKLKRASSIKKNSTEDKTNKPGNISKTINEVKK
jgi:hypothetical protein